MKGHRGGGATRVEASLLTLSAISFPSSLTKYYVIYSALKEVNSL